MAKRRVIKAMDVVPFTSPGLENIYQSRLLIEQDGAGSSRLQLVHATLAPGTSPGGGATHPAPYDEAYYILSGTGRMEFDHGEDVYEVGPGTAIFIPGGTFHEIHNIGQDDLVFLTIWPLTPAEEGVNGIFDERKKAWGTSFRTVED